MNIITEQISYPTQATRRWTYSAIHCLERGCQCKDCIIQKIITSGTCKMKIAVLELTRKLGKPTKEEIQKLYNQRKLCK